MSYKVYTGLPDSEVDFLQECLTAVSPECIIERIPLAGVRSKIRNTGASAEVVMIILEETYYDKCAGVAMNVLSLPKTHKWVSREGLISFLKTQFGDFEVPNSNNITSEDDTVLEILPTDEIPSSFILSEEEDTSQDIIDNMKDEYNQLQEQLDELKISTENKIPEYIQQIDDLNKQVSELTAYKNLSKVQEESIASLRDSLQELNIQNNNSGVLLEEYEGRDKALKGKLDSLVLELEDSKIKISELETKAEEISLKDSTIDSLTEQLNSLREDLDSVSKAKTLLENEVKSYMETVSKLENEVSSLNIKLANKGTLELKLETLADQNSTLSTSNEQLQERIKNLQDLETNFVELTKEKQELEEILETKEQEKKFLENEIENFKVKLETLDSKSNEISELKQSLGSLKSELENKEAENQDLGSQISNLKIQLADYEGLIEGLKAELVQANLKASQSEELHDIKFELQQSKLAVSSLEEENNILSYKLDEQKETVQSLTSNLDLSKSELSKLQEQISSRDLQLAEKEDMLSELAEDVFYKISNSCTPKAGIHVSLPVEINSLDNIIVTASGSNESTSYVSRFIRTEIENSPNKQFVIIDLASETFIDSQLGMGETANPINWLTGKSSIKNTLTSTRFSNTKALILGVNYINDSYLLAVNWNEKLKELNELGVTVILNVGCINSLVQNILFNTFAKLCKSYIIANASPSNLRGCILHISAFAELPKLTVLCFKYSETSKGLFLKLSQMANTRILQKGEAIGI